MNLTTTDRCFTRRTGTLWRDTGRHVLALPESDGADVVVLGGGSAVLWRLLERPQSLPGILRRLAEAGGDAPTEDDVRACLDDLVTRSLIDCDPEPSA